MPEPQRTRELLLVEDNPADLSLMNIAFSELETEVRLRSVTSVPAALELLRGVGEHAGEPPPELVLLDLRVQGADGGELLEELAATPALGPHVVLVLSSSRNPDDVHRLHRLGANAYVPKPLDLDGYRAMVAGIDAFWLRHAKLPKLAGRRG